VKRVSHSDLSHVKLLLLDFDGVLTDNRVIVHQDGTESVVCSRSDGWGIARLREAGVKVAVVSTETNPVVTARCTKLKIDVAQLVVDKAAAVTHAMSVYGVSREQTAFAGNDVNDIPAMLMVGVPIAVTDSHHECVAAAEYLTEARGGYGAVREIADAILGTVAVDGFKRE
jgi:3-deoxy-D-manno-octulosonate 8-phosphate phosphatase (KDO 8-P phosphatase)